MRAPRYYAAVIESRPAGFSEPDAPSSEVYDRCVRCGLCLPSCPTYLETFSETSSPRGRIALIKAVDEGRLDLTSPGFIHQMSECLGCRACEAACPTGVANGALLEDARTQIVRATAGAEPPERRVGRAVVFGALFGSPPLFRAAATLLRFYQRSGLARFARSIGILRALRLESLEALAPRMSDRFFVPRGESWPATRQPAKATVVVHAGCVMAVAFADVDRATVRVLQRAGCNVVAPRVQGCCGALAAHAGDLRGGRERAKRNIVAFERSDADFYVVNAAGCGASLKDYGRWFADDAVWGDRAAAFAARVRDVTEFLDAVGIDPKLGALPGVVTYQEPCHLAHAQGISAAPRRLLAQIPGLVSREMDESSLCCGSAGTYNLTQPDMAERLQRRKIANVVAVDPTVVATANPGCALQLANGLRANGHPATVKHVVELLDEAYAAYRPTSRASSPSAASTVG